MYDKGGLYVLTGLMDETGGMIRGRSSTRPRPLSSSERKIGLLNFCEFMSIEIKGID